MFYYPYAPVMDDWYRARQANSFIRITNVSPNSPGLDVYANGILLIANISYKQMSPYIPMVPGGYNIRVFPTGTTTNPLIDMNMLIPESTAFNLAIIGRFPDISLLPIQEPATGQNFGRPCIRFAHLSPSAPAVDIAISQSNKLFTNISYKNVTDYVCLPTGTYTFQVSPTGTNNPVLTIPDVQLNADTYYTLYIIGEANGSPPLEAVLLSEPR